jgi:hypothetical protein
MVNNNPSVYLHVCQDTVSAQMFVIVQQILDTHCKDKRFEKCFENAFACPALQNGV